MAESKFPWISKKKHGTSKAFHAELILVCTMATTLEGSGHRVCSRIRSHSVYCFL